MFELYHIFVRWQALENLGFFLEVMGIALCTCFDYL